jgi:hypothetical protein
MQNDLTIGDYLELMMDNIDEMIDQRLMTLRECWNLLSAARRPTRGNSDDNRVTCSGAIALLI